MFCLPVRCLRLSVHGRGLAAPITLAAVMILWRSGRSSVGWFLGASGFIYPRIGAFLGDSRRAGATVVLVRTIIAPDSHSRSTLQWPEFMRSGMAPGAPGTEFDPSLQAQPGDLEIVKQRYSAFFGTRLDEILRGRGD